jgi:hypothetical protein
MGKVGPPRRKPGRMGPYVEGFRGSLLASGYSPGSVRHMLKDMGGLGRWMVREDVAAGDLSPTVIGDFLRICVRKGSGACRACAASTRFWTTYAAKVCSLSRMPRLLRSRF